MPKLNPNAQIKINKTILSKILYSYDAKVLSFAIAKGGIENTTILVHTSKGQFALRVYRKAKKGVKHITQELAFMAFLQEHGLPVPMVFRNNQNKFITTFKVQSTVWKAVLMELMPGTHPKIYSETLIREYARAQAKMHKLGINFAKHQPKYWRLDRLKEGEFIKHIKLSSLKNKVVYDALRRAKRYIVILDPKLPRGFNHLDYDHANTLVENNKLSAILDFDDLTYSPLVVCLGYTLWDILYTNKNKFELKKLRLYLREYQKIRRLKPIEIRYLKDVLLFRNYVIMALEIMFWGENAKYTKTFLKLEKLFLNIKIENYI